MADTKITALAAISTIDVNPATSPIPIVDLLDNSMAASGTTKKVTVNQILGSGGTATLASATITGDLTVATNGLKVDSANKNVGINTATPTNTAGYKTLEIVGTGVNTAGMLRFKSSDTSVNTLDFADSNGRAIFAISNHPVRFGCNDIEQYRINPLGVFTWFDGAGGTRMTLNSTGLGVGIAPVTGYRLSVAGSGLGDGPTKTVMVVRNTDAPVAGVGSGIALSANVGTFSANLVTIEGVKENATTDNYASALVFSTRTNAANLAERLRIDSTGNVGIGVTPSAGGGCLQLKSGITFPVTQIPSSNANTLDDYVEGSWVPTLNSGTFSSASCRYTKIGNMVTIFFDVTVGTGGGDRITNLPFAAASTSTVANGIYTNNQTYAAGTTAPVVVVGGSSSTLFFRTVGTGVAFSAMTFTAAANLTGSISYFV